MFDVKHIIIILSRVKDMSEVQKAIIPALWEAGKI